MKKRDLDALINLAFAAGGIWLGWFLLSQVSGSASAPDFVRAARRFLDTNSVADDSAAPDEESIVTMKRGADGVYRPSGAA